MASVRMLELSRVKRLDELARSLHHFPSTQHLTLGKLWISQSQRLAWLEHQATLEIQLAKLRSISLRARIFEPSAVTGSIWTSFLDACYKIPRANVDLSLSEHVPRIRTFLRVFEESSIACHISLSARTIDEVELSEVIVEDYCIEAQIQSLTSTLLRTIRVASSAFDVLLDGIFGLHRSIVSLSLGSTILDRFLEYPSLQTMDALQYIRAEVEPGKRSIKRDSLLGTTCCGDIAQSLPDSRRAEQYGRDVGTKLTPHSIRAPRLACVDFSAHVRTGTIGSDQAEALTRWLR